MVTGLLCAGLALALTLLVALHLRLAAIPVAVWSAMRRERDEAAPRALDAMKEAVAARVGPAVVALRQYQDNIAGSFRAQVADAEYRARIAERRAAETAEVVREARAVVRELREVLDAARDLGVASSTRRDRSETPTLPPSDAPPAPRAGAESGKDGAW